MIKYNSPKYMNKLDILYRIKTGEEIEDVWKEVQDYRKENGIELPLLDQDGKNLFVLLTEELKKNIVYIDKTANENLYDRADEEIKKKVMAEALMDEAFQSSLIEGAHTTKKKTKKMIEENIKPKNKSEKMVLNNFVALKYVMENKNRPMTEKTVLDIYKIVTRNTLDEDDKVDKYRIDQNEVLNQMNEVIYTPPLAENVQWMMDDLLKFLYEDSKELHPVLKAIIFHYYFVYIHPFHDGNGRTARALTYMYLLQKGYSFFKYFSISSMIVEERGNYYKSIKNSEDSDSDTTFFSLFYGDMISKSIDKVTFDFFKQYSKIIIDKKIELNKDIINKRQKKAITFMIKYNKKIDVNTFSNKLNKVSIVTGRKDLDELVILDILEKKVKGKKNEYSIKIK